jgi:hypothetical protein
LNNFIAGFLGAGSKCVLGKITNMFFPDEAIVQNGKKFAAVWHFDIKQSIFYH